MLIQTVKPLYGNIGCRNEELRCQDKEQPGILVQKCGHALLRDASRRQKHAPSWQQRRRFIRNGQGRLSLLEARRGQRSRTLQGIGITRDGHDDGGREMTTTTDYVLGVSTPRAIRHIYKQGKTSWAALPSVRVQHQGHNISFEESTSNWFPEKSYRSVIGNRCLHYSVCVSSQPCTVNPSQITLNVRQRKGPASDRACPDLQGPWQAIRKTKGQTGNQRTGPSWLWIVVVARIGGQWPLGSGPSG